MTQKPQTLVIAGSVRPRRLCMEIASWVAKVGREGGGDFELVDLKKQRLPLDDEPEIPATGRYKHAHTRAWSRKAAAAKAFVFVTPQYNWGYPAALKNALDHLHAEWAGKPAMIVAYGARGGGQCAAQLGQVLQGLRMNAIATVPQLVLPRAMIEANAGRIDPAATFAAHLPELRQAFAELTAALATPEGGPKA